MLATILALVSSSSQQNVTLAWVIGLVAGPFLTVIHELGHVVAAKAVGFPVRAIVIGRGQRVFLLKFGSVPFEVRTVPYGGLTMFQPVDGPHVVRAEAVVAMAGPLADLIVGTAAVILSLSGHVLFVGIAIVETVSFIGNLVPRSSVRASDGLHATDGWQVSQALHGRVSPQVIVARAEGLRDVGKIDEALLMVDRIDDVRLTRQIKNRMVVWLIHAGRFEDARTLCLHELWARHGTLTPPARGVLLNNMAYAGILTRNPQFITEDRPAAFEAQALLPDVHSVMNTLGLVLALSGDPDAGSTWCERAMGEIGATPEHQAIRIASQAVCAAVRGDGAAADAQSAEALRMSDSAATMSLAVLACSRTLHPGVFPPLPVTAAGRPDVLLAMARAEALGDAGRWGDATTVVMRTLDAAGPDASRSQRALLCRRLALCALISGEIKFHDAAQSAIDGLDALGADDPESLQVIGWWAIEHNDVSRGIGLCRRALTSGMRPRDRAMALATVALGQLRNDNPTGAATALAEARAVDADAPLIAKIAPYVRTAAPAGPVT